MIKFVSITVCLLQIFHISLYSQIESIQSYQPKPESQLVFYRGEIELSRPGVWTIEGESDLLQTIFIQAKSPPSFIQSGKRFEAVTNQRRVEASKSGLRNTTQQFLQLKRQDQTTPPNPRQEKLKEQYQKRLTEQLDRVPWHDIRNSKIDGPFYFIDSEAEFILEKGQNQVAQKDKKTLTYELRPYNDDGMHWVGYTDSSVERIPIDYDYLTQKGQTIRPLSDEEKGINSVPTGNVRYLLYASTQKAPKGPVKVFIKNLADDRKIQFDWDLSQATPGNIELEIDYNKAISNYWYENNRYMKSPILNLWALSKNNGDRNVFRGPTQRRQRNLTPNLIELLTGRVAIAETLQLDTLRTTQATPNTIDISSIEGVTVKEHPFEEMLGDSQALPLEVATVVPIDRFFLYAGKPTKLFETLDTALETLNNIRGAVSGDIREYHLKRKYLDRLGLTSKWIQLFLNSGSVEDLALYTSDLNLVDGADITACIRLNNTSPITPLLSALGYSTTASQTIFETKNQNGASTYWALSENFLFCSTLQSEIEKSLALQQNDGDGSLGLSHEFRYMLAKLPLSERTRAWAYFSDPFIRKSTSPAGKIRQLRRSQTKADLRRLTAAALLAKMEGFESELSISELKRLNYLPSDFQEKDYQISSDLVAISKKFGRLDNLAPLSAFDVQKVSRNEANAYNRFRENYTRYWRLFFDPIAIRLDETKDNGLSTETFILPLIDNTLYNALRESLHAFESDTKLRPITYEETPILNLSLNLTDSAWVEITKRFSRFATGYAQLSPEIFDYLGDTIHFSVLDANPVLSNGSGNLTGFLGSSFTGGNGFQGMAMMPMAIALLTQPCKLVIESNNIHRVRALLKNSSLTNPQNRDIRVKFLQIGDQDRWTFSLNLMGIISLRYGIEIVDKSVVISNIPWLEETRLSYSKTNSLNAARFELYPSAAQEQLPALHAVAAEQASEATWQSAESLYPLLVSGYSTIDTVSQDHKKLFGYAPKHPQGGSYTWDGYTLNSDRYGTANNKSRPPHQKGDRDFGLFSQFEKFSVEMQFEEDGLRSKMTWKLSEN